MCWLCADGWVGVEFVKLYVRYYMVDSVKAQFEAFYDGFHSVAGGPALKVHLRVLPVCADVCAAVWFGGVSHAVSCVDICCVCLSGVLVSCSDRMNWSCLCAVTLSLTLQR